MLSQDTRGEKNEFLYLLTYRLPEEMSGGNFVTEILWEIQTTDPEPRFSKKWLWVMVFVLFYSAQYFETRLLLWIVLFLFLFSSVIRLWILQHSGSSWGWDVTSCLALPSPLLPFSNLPHFRLTGILRFSLHHPSICPLHPYLISPYWWKPQQTSAPLKTSNKKIDHWVTAVWPWGQWFALKSLCVCW